MEPPGRPVGRGRGVISCCIPPPHTHPPPHDCDTARVRLSLFSQGSCCDHRVCECASFAPRPATQRSSLGGPSPRDNVWMPANAKWFLKWAGLASHAVRADAVFLTADFTSEGSYDGGVGGRSSQEQLCHGPRCWFYNSCQFNNQGDFRVGIEVPLFKIYLKLAVLRIFISWGSLKDLRNVWH